MRLEDVFNYVNYNTSWVDDIENKEILRIAENYSNQLTNVQQKRVIHRLCGQSGSGKTTQLCEALIEVYEEKKINPLVIGVRTFSVLHPNYPSLLKKFGKELIREKTNGFALKCLCAVLSFLIEKEVFLILDLTILDPIIEEFIANLLMAKRFEINYHILSVSKKISDQFIRKRELGKGSSEAGRITLKSSSYYFYKILPIGLKYLIKNYPDINCVVWNVFDKLPCYVGKIKFCMDSFNKNRHIFKKFLYDEDELRTSKFNFYKNFFLNSF